MIPKIVHICWLSGDPFPSSISKCLESWRLFFYDYEIWFWGKIPDGAREHEFKGMVLKQMSFDLNATIWTRQAFESKKYAFAADYIRLYALYSYGGIYLDSDVIIYKSFNQLLNLPYFIGQEQMGSIEPAIIGAEKHCSWIGDLLTHYENRPFVLPNGLFDTKPLPWVCYDVLCSKYIFIRLHKLYKYEYDVTKIFVYDKDFFNSRNRIEPIRTSKSFCSHAYAGSWMKETKGLKNYVRSILPKWFLKIFLYISHKTWNRAAEHICEPKFYSEII